VKHRDNEALWEAVRIEYETGSYSVSDIAALYRVGRQTLKNHIRKGQWTRGFNEVAIKKATERAAKAAEQTEKHTQKRTELILYRTETAAEMYTNLICKHKNQLSRASAACVGMLGELEAQSLSAQDIQALAAISVLAQQQQESGYVEDAGAVERAAAALRRLLTLDNRAGTLKTLSDVMKSMVVLERLVCGIVDDPERNKPKDITTDMNDAARRIAYLLTNGEKKEK